MKFGFSILDRCLHSFMCVTTGKWHRRKLDQWTMVIGLLMKASLTLSPFTIGRFGIHHYTCQFTYALNMFFFLSRIVYQILCDDTKFKSWLASSHNMDSSGPYQTSLEGDQNGLLNPFSRQSFLSNDNSSKHNPCFHLWCMPAPIELPKWLLVF